MSGNILDVSCPSFVDGQIPVRHTGFGEDISPEIVIGGPFSETKTLAIVMDDLDVPFILAIYFGVRARKKKEDKNSENYGLIGMCMGMCIGISLQGIVGSVGTGISLGMLAGLVIGSLIEKVS